MFSIIGPIASAIPWKIAPTKVTAGAISSVIRDATLFNNTIEKFIIASTNSGNLSVVAFKILINKSIRPSVI